MNKMIAYAKGFFKNTLNFSGRTDLEQFYMPAPMIGLIAGLYSIALGIIVAVLSLVDFLQVVAGILMFIGIFALSVVLGLASLSCGIRRLHDTGHHWYFIFIALIPIAGIFILMFTFLHDTTENALGEPTTIDYYDNSMPPQNYGGMEPQFNNEQGVYNDGYGSGYTNANEGLDQEVDL